MFIIDLYTIDNKISRYDVGGLEYVYSGARESLKSVAEDSIYKTVENNSSHFLRHSKATYLLNVKKEDVVTVKEILRHKSIDSTLIYLNPEEEAINKVRINNDL